MFSGEKAAVACLSAHQWNLELAVSGFFDSPESYLGRDDRNALQAVDRRKVEQFYNKYRGNKFELYPIMFL